MIRANPPTYANTASNRQTRTALRLPIAPLHMSKRRQLSRRLYRQTARPPNGSTDRWLHRQIALSTGQVFHVVPVAVSGDVHLRHCQGDELAGYRRGSDDARVRLPPYVGPVGSALPSRKGGSCSTLGPPWTGDARCRAKDQRGRCMGLTRHTRPCDQVRPSDFKVPSSSRQCERTLTHSFSPTRRPRRCSISRRASVPTCFKRLPPSPMTIPF